MHLKISTKHSPLIRNLIKPHKGKARLRTIEPWFNWTHRPPNHISTIIANNSTRSTNHLDNSSSSGKVRIHRASLRKANRNNIALNLKLCPANVANLTSYRPGDDDGCDILLSNLFKLFFPGCWRGRPGCEQREGITREILPVRKLAKAQSSIQLKFKWIVFRAYGAWHYFRLVEVEQYRFVAGSQLSTLTQFAQVSIAERRRACTMGKKYKRSHLGLLLGWSWRRRDGCLAKRN